jgi:hypothetical protein
MKFSKFESGSEMKYQHSIMSGQSSCPKDEALRTTQVGWEREHMHKITIRQNMSN